jgi:hypothetical protein
VARLLVASVFCWQLLGCNWLAAWWQLKISGKQGGILIISMVYLVGSKIPMQVYVHE